ncbi:Tetratricopeptide repeat protein [compost metagenome]
MKRGDYADALEKVEISLGINASNNLAMGLKALALVKLGREADALAFIDAGLHTHPLSYALHYARWAISQDAAAREKLLLVTGRRGANACVLAGWLTSMGMSFAAREVLDLLDSQETLPQLWRAALSDNAETRIRHLAAARCCEPNRVRFPNALDEVQMLQTLQDDAFARYQLGCFWYSRRRYDEAVSCWQFTLQQEPQFAPAQRLLGIYAWNKQHDLPLAQQYLQRAVELEPENPRFLFELDYLNKLTGEGVAKRLAMLSVRESVALKRDDLTAELLSLWNSTGRYADAADVLKTREFHPWEGGEGKVTGQYLLNQQHRALQYIASGDFAEAINLLQAALCYPHNLGEGRLPGQTDNDIWYLLGYCHARCDSQAEAQRCFTRAAQGGSSLDAGRYYNDQPADYLFWQGMAVRALGDSAAAERHFNGFLSWVKAHQDDVPEADFFAVSLPELVVLDAPAGLQHQQHCLFIEVLGHAGREDTAASQRCIDTLLTLNPAHDKAHFIQHAQAAGIFN